MITKKTKEEIESLKEGGKILGRILKEVASSVRSGVSTHDLDEVAEQLIKKAGGVPSFKGYNPYGASRPYPASLCVSLNDEVVHAIPSKRRVIKEGDVVSLDIGMWWPKKGVRDMAVDAAVTLAVGKVPERTKELIEATEASLWAGIKEVKPGVRMGAVSAAIQAVLDKKGLGVVRELAGHGVGYEVHEEPYVPNFGKAGTGPLLEEGMVIAIEPMATEGTHKVKLDRDEWTFRTADGSSAAHFEHTVVVGNRGPIVVTDSAN